MAVIRTSSGVSVAAALWGFLLPFGRPGRRLAAESFCFLAAALALRAAFSASLRMTCSMRIGNDRRFWTLTRESVKKASPGDRLTVQAGEEPIEAMGVLADFRDDDFIASDEVDISRAVHMLTKEHPKQHRPREDGGKPALDGAITAAFASPAGDAQHRDASSHHQQGKGYPAQLAVSRRRDMGSEALERCYNVHHGLLRRLRVVVVVDDNSTIELTTEALPVQILAKVL